ncbi:hypothetical protein [Streptomyces sp. NPDC051561]
MHRAARGVSAHTAIAAAWALYLPRADADHRRVFAVLRFLEGGG